MNTEKNEVEEIFEYLTNCINFWTRELYSTESLNKKNTIKAKIEVYEELRTFITLNQM